MQAQSRARLAIRGCAAWVLLVWVLAQSTPSTTQAAPPRPQPAAAGADFNDSHFHLTNYIQEGIDVRAVPADHGRRGSAASTLFGIPLQQQWSYGNSGDFAPTYYLQTDAPLYYYSFTDAYIASAYRSLPPDAAGALRSDDHRLQPGRHVRAPITSAACCGRSRACSPASASSAIHKEFVSSKVAGETASLTNPALDRILDFAGEVGLVVDPPQRHRHAVREAGRRAGVPRRR